jgi:hypothetical protein
MGETDGQNGPSKQETFTAQRRPLPTAPLTPELPLQQQALMQQLDSGALNPDRMKQTTAELRLPNTDPSVSIVTPEMRATLGVLGTVEGVTIPDATLQNPDFIAAFDSLYSRFRSEITFGTEMQRTQAAAKMAATAAVREARLSSQVREAKGIAPDPEDAKDIAQNKWRAPLEAQGLRFDVPDFFELGADLPREIMQKDVTVDKLTNLPLENDAVRTEITRNVETALRNGDEVIIVSADEDNLKQANTELGKPFGNMLIRGGASKITRALADMKLPEGVKVVVVRQTGAADETIAWITGIPKVDEGNPMHVDTLRNTLQQRINEATAPAQATLDKDGKPVTFTFSTTATVMATTDPRIATEVRNVRENTNGEPTNHTYELYNTMKEITDVEVSAIKISKDLGRLPIESLRTAKGLEEVKQRLTEEIGNSRISKPLFKASMDIVSGLAWLYGKQNAASDEAFATDIEQQTGFTLEELSELSSGDAMEQFWQRQLTKRASVGVK